MAQEVESSELVAIQAMVHPRSFLEVHTTEASAERAAFIVLQISPCPNAVILRDSILIVPGYCERFVRKACEAINAVPLQDGQDI